MRKDLRKEISIPYQKFFTGPMNCLEYPIVLLWSYAIAKNLTIEKKQPIRDEQFVYNQV